MEILEKSTIIITDKKCKELLLLLDKSFQILIKDKYNSIAHAIKVNGIEAIIAKINNSNDINIDLIQKIQNTFPHVPKIGLIDNKLDVEMIRKCGEIGINKLILPQDYHNLSAIICDMIDKNCLKITLDELEIQYINEPIIVQNALFIIQRSYLELKFIEDIANELDVSYSLLAGMINKSNVPNLKKVLLLFKIRHSLYLLQQKNLTINEISNICGFSNEKRYREGFYRVFGKNPSQCQCKLNSSSINEYWKSNLTI